MTTKIDELLDLHVESRARVLELFGVEPSWHAFTLSDERGHWWCIVSDELVSQYQEHVFEDETIRRGWYRVQDLVRPHDRSIYEVDGHVLVFIERDFGKVFCVFDADCRLTDEQARFVQENL